MMGLFGEIGGFKVNESMLTKTILTKKITRKFKNKRWVKKYSKKYSKQVPMQMVFVDNNKNIYAHPSVLKQLCKSINKQYKSAILPEGRGFKNPDPIYMPIVPSVHKILHRRAIANQKLYPIMYRFALGVRIKLNNRIIGIEKNIC